MSNKQWKQIRRKKEDISIDHRSIERGL